MGVEFNPYNPPREDTTLTPSSSGRRGWRIYAYAIATFFLAVVGFQFSKSDSMRLSDCLDTVWVLLSLVGLFGYAYRRPVLWRRFWMVAGIVLPLWELATELWGYPWQEHHRSLNSTLDYVGMTLVFGPLYLALFLYGYKSKKIWAKDSGAAG